MDKIHVLLRAGFVDLLRIRCLSAKSLLAASTELVLVYIRTVNIKKRNHNGSHDDFLLSCKIGCKKQTADLALMAPRFSRAFLQESFTSKCWVWSRVEAMNFTWNKGWKRNKNRLSICRLTSELNYSGKKCQKNARFINDALKTKGITYLNIKTWLLFAPSPSKISGYAPESKCSSMLISAHKDCMYRRYKPRFKLTWRTVAARV